MSAELAVGYRVAGLLNYLPKQVREPERPMLALATAWLLTFPISIVLAALVSLVFPGAQQPQFPVSGLTALFLLVIFAPVLETLIMGGVLLVLLRLFSPATAVVLSAIGWGIGHSLGAPTWGLVIWWPFLIFSTLFVVWRQRGFWAGVAVASATHALQNLIPALVVAGYI